MGTQAEIWLCNAVQASKNMCYANNIAVGLPNLIWVTHLDFQVHLLLGHLGCAALALTALCSCFPSLRSVGT